MINKNPRGRPKYKDILTPAEWRVVDAVRHGMTSRQIAERRDISIDAVKYHVANALQKLGFSSRVELRAWDGVAAASPLSSKETSMPNDLKLDQIGQISRNVADIKAATQWYSDTLGLEHLFSFGDLAFFNCGGIRLFLNQSDGKLAQDSIIYFRVDDIHKAKLNLEGRGITFINAPHMIHKHEDGMEEWMAFFNDIDDRPLALMSQVSASQASEEKGNDHARKTKRKECSKIHIRFDRHGCVVCKSSKCIGKRRFS